MKGDLSIAPIEKKRKSRSAEALPKTSSVNEFCEQVDVAGTGDTSTRNHAKKNWTKRPANWMSIAEDAEVHGNVETITKFISDFDGMTETAANRKLYKWKKDLKNKKPPKYVTRMPEYGKAIDDLLFDDFVRARIRGLPTSDDALRQYLKVHLSAAKLEHLLQEGSGKNTFGASWAARFCRRHHVGPRTKYIPKINVLDDSKNQERQEEEQEDKEEEEEEEEEQQEEQQEEIRNKITLNYNNLDNPIKNEELPTHQVDHVIASASLRWTASNPDNLQLPKITRRNSF